MLVQMASTSLVGSTRTAKAEEADGVVPQKFERPFVRPATELLVQQLQGLRTSTMLTTAKGNKIVTVHKLFWGINIADKVISEKK